MAKKSLTLLMMMFMVYSCYAKTTECSKPTHDFSNGHCNTTFKVNVEEAGYYYFGAWICPALLADSTYEQLSLRINDENSIKTLNFSRGDWQFITDESIKIRLNKGNNIFTFIGDSHLYPNVEAIKVGTIRKEVEFDENKYKVYREKIKFETETFQNHDSPDTVTKHSLKSYYFPSQNNPPYRLDYRLNALCKYTYYTTMHFTQGQYLAINTNSGTSTHIIELLSTSNASSYSWSEISSEIGGSSSASLYTTIPYTDNYIVRVRGFWDQRSGTCNLALSTGQNFTNIPFYSVGLSSSQSTRYEYNSFTCHSTGDTRIWIEGASGDAGPIVAYNDDYYGLGDFHWNTNSRVKKIYSNPTRAVLVSSYSSFSPEFTCDIYGRCENYTDVISTFPHFNPDDAIKSSLRNESYNCISWTGGIYTAWCWPPSVFSDFCDDDGDDLASFDNFYNNERYPNCVRYTRTGATSMNSILDLWAVMDEDEADYQHASIRKGSDSNAHGYDWESKIGTYSRTYHERYALRGDVAYGFVVNNYIVDNAYPSSGITLEESVADGLAVIEYGAFSKDERNALNSGIQNISTTDKSEFEKLYKKCVNWCTNSIYSNPNRLRHSNDYQQLINLCKSTNMRMAVFQKLEEESIVSPILIEDLYLKGNESILNSIKEINSKNKYTEDGKFIFRTIHSNATKFVKAIISNYIKKLEKDVLFSSDDIVFYAYEIDGDIMVEFENQSHSIAKVDIIDLKTDNLITIQSEKAGNKQYVKQSIKKPGVYLVRLTIAGKSNVKKIIVK